MRTRLSSLLIFAACAAACLPRPAFAESLRETPAVKVVREWGPSVANIGTERLVAVETNPWTGQGFFDDLPTRVIGTMTLKNLGSGVIVSTDGLIITNAHVVQMASKIYVTLSDGKTAEARLIGTNTADDLALIQIDPPETLKAAAFAEDVMIGETVVAVGNSLGLQNSVTSGVVSGTGRALGSDDGRMQYTDLIQTDASINPGSSGGALFNLDGQLIGINLAIVKGAQNIAFAIPGYKVKNMLEEYRRHLLENRSAPKNPKRVIDIPVE